MAVVLSVVPSLEMVRDFDGFIFRGGERHRGVTDLHRVISALGQIVFRHERPPLRFWFAMCGIYFSPLERRTKLELLTDLQVPSERVTDPTSACRHRSVPAVPCSARRPCARTRRRF